MTLRGKFWRYVNARRCIYVWSTCETVTLVEKLDQFGGRALESDKKLRVLWSIYFAAMLCQHHSTAMLYPPRDGRFVVLPPTYAV